MSVVFAVTAHGLGHWTRVASLLNALGELSPETEFVVASALDPQVVARDLRIPYALERRTYEPGAAHRTCFEVDAEETRAQYARYFAERGRLLEEEIAFLREVDAQAVLVDVPALAVRAAAEVGKPAIAVANFTWDWLLEPIFAGSALQGKEQILAEDYALGARHFRLPFGPDTSPFPASEPAPLISRRATLDAREVRRVLGITGDDDRRLALVCPGGWPASEWTDIHVPGCADYRFVTVGDLPIRFESPSLALSHAMVPPVTFPDLVAASDVVVAKPGYGIASECVLHRTPMVCIERPAFRETPVLLEHLRALGPSAELSLEEFFAGHWQAVLDGVLSSTQPWAEVEPDGAGQLARRIAADLELT